MTKGNVEEDEWNAITHQHLVLVQRFNRVINTEMCQVLRNVRAHGFRAVIRLCDTGTADMPGRLAQTAIRESADGRFISERPAADALSEIQTCLKLENATIRFDIADFDLRSKLKNFHLRHQREKTHRRKTELIFFIKLAKGFQ